MRIDLHGKNKALELIFTNPDTIIFLDANFFIAPDRSVLGTKPISFGKYKSAWLEPLFNEFSNLAIHESVYDELISTSIRNFITDKQNEVPKRLEIYTDSMLNEVEKSLMQTYISKIARHSQYLPDRDNAKDRGEVRSLSYMAVKNFLYFAANDGLPIRLINNARELQTGLDDMSVLQMFEMIYYLYSQSKYNNTTLRTLYKYQYYLTPSERNYNPSWNNFIIKMDSLYK